MHPWQSYKLAVFLGLNGIFDWKCAAILGAKIFLEKFRRKELTGVG
jgi:hypothetical protein